MSNLILDRLSGLFFTLLGGLVLLGALQMPRYTERGAALYETPGFTPGLLGVALAMCGVILILRPAGTAGKDFSFWNEVMGAAITRKRALAALVLTLGYGAILFGTVPYLIATFAFVFAFICTFELILIPADKPRETINRPRILMIATALALLVSFATRYVFQTLFLIQLP